jgi:hypothetical protein
VDIATQILGHLGVLVVGVIGGHLLLKAQYRRIVGEYPWILPTASYPRAMAAVFGAFRILDYLIIFRFYTLMRGWP